MAFVAQGRTCILSCRDPQQTKPEANIFSPRSVRLNGGLIFWFFFIKKKEQEI